MMVTLSEPNPGVSDRLDVLSVVADRLEEFGVKVLAGEMNRPVQMVNGEAYLRGLLEQGARKSLEQMARSSVGMLIIRACSSSWLIARGILGWWSGNPLSGSPR